MNSHKGCRHRHSNSKVYIFRITARSLGSKLQPVPFNVFVFIVSLLQVSVYGKSEITRELIHCIEIKVWETHY